MWRVQFQLGRMRQRFTPLTHSQSAHHVTCQPIKSSSQKNAADVGIGQRRLQEWVVSPWHSFGQNLTRCPQKETHPCFLSCLQPFTPLSRFRYSSKRNFIIAASVIHSETRAADVEPANSPTYTAKNVIAFWGQVAGSTPPTETKPLGEPLQYIQIQRRGCNSRTTSQAIVQSEKAGHMSSCAEFLDGLKTPSWEPLNQGIEETKPNIALISFIGEAAWQRLNRANPHDPHGTLSPLESLRANNSSTP